MSRKETIKLKKGRGMSVASEKMGGCGSAGSHAMPGKSAPAGQSTFTQQNPPKSKKH